eukprot:scaffold576_cov336-Pavlova_lutheri.AAC.10
MDTVFELGQHSSSGHRCCALLFALQIGSFANNLASFEVASTFIAASVGLAPRERSDLATWASVPR